MLWSVVVCDLLFKLQHLVDLYDDDKAKTILAEIGKLRHRYQCNWSNLGTTQSVHRPS